MTQRGRGGQAVLRVPRACTHRTSPRRPRHATPACFPARTRPRTPAYNAADVCGKAAVHPRPAADDADRCKRASTSSTAVASSRCKPSTTAIAQADRHAARHRPARQHLHRVHLRQRLPPRAVPHAGRQADAVRLRHPRAARRPRPRDPGATEPPTNSSATSISPRRSRRWRGVAPPPFVDGRSFLRSRRTRRRIAPWRNAYLIEHWKEIDAGEPRQWRAARTARPRSEGPGSPSAGGRRRTTIPEYHGVHAAVHVRRVRDRRTRALRRPPTRTSSTTS